MRHPLLYKRSHLYHYLIDCLILSAIHVFLVVRFCNLSVTEAIADALIYNGLFAVLGFFCWYTVRFISIDVSVILNQSITALFFMTGWLFAGYIILHGLQLSDHYNYFLKAALPWRFVEGLFLYSIIALVYYLYKYYQSYKDRATYKAALNTAMKERELALLKSQLQPHFIFNTLNSIQSLMLSDASRAQDMLTKLASFLRLSMNQAEDKIIALNEELENSALYSDIEKIRFGERLLIVHQMEEGVAGTLVPHLILQPLVENAIRHGLHQMTETVTIIVCAVKTEKGIVISVSNNHDPLQKKQSGHGTGLLNVRRRMNLLYGRKDLVKVKDEKGIFEVSLLIPLY